jgi:hypothetical protein
MQRRCRLLVSQALASGVGDRLTLLQVEAAVDVAEHEEDSGEYVRASGPQCWSSLPRLS